MRSNLAGRSRLTPASAAGEGDSESFFRPQAYARIFQRGCVCQLRMRGFGVVSALLKFPVSPSTCTSGLHRLRGTTLRCSVYKPYVTSGCGIRRAVCPRTGMIGRR